MEADLVGAGINDRTLSTRFLKLLLTGAYKNGEMEREGIHIRGAVFPHRVIIKNAAVPYSVWLKDCQFLEGADLEYTRFDHDLSLEGSSFLANPANGNGAVSRLSPHPSEVNFLAIGMQVKGPLNLNHAVFHAPINLTYADIGGDLYVDSVRYLSAEIADLQCLRVRGLTFFRHDSFAATLRLSDSDLFQVFMEDSQTIPRLELDRTKVERGFSFSDTTVGALAARFFTVDGNAFFDNVAFSKSVDLSHSRFQTITIRGLERWLGAGNIRIEGISFEGVEIVSGSSRVPAIRMLDLIDAESSYSPQPYMELEKCLRLHGDPEEADQVYVAMRRKQRAELSWWKWPWDWLLEELVGYGKRPYRTAWLALVIVVVGRWVFRRNRMVEEEDKYTNDWYSATWYSLDLFAPVIDLGMAKRWKPKKTSHWLNTYAQIHRMAGWVLLPLILAAITGILQ